MILNSRITTAALLAGLAVVGGCTWVKPEPGASRVMLVAPTHVQHCQSLGTTTSQVKHEVGGIYRSERKVNEELLTLARNSAVEAGGDTLVAETSPSGGSQRFRIYKCQ